jgi:hypothetical protein
VFKTFVVVVVVVVGAQLPTVFNYYIDGHLLICHPIVFCYCFSPTGYSVTR